MKYLFGIFNSGRKYEIIDINKYYCDCNPMHDCLLKPMGYMPSYQLWLDKAHYNYIKSLLSNKTKVQIVVFICNLSQMTQYNCTVKCIDEENSIIFTSSEHGKLCNAVVDEKYIVKE